MEKRKLKISGSIAIFLLSLMTVTGSYAQEKMTSTNSSQVAKQDEIVSVLKQGKAIFVVISKQGLKDKEKALSICKESQKALSGKVETIEVDADNKADENLLKTLKITEPLKEPVTIVINKQGFVTGQFTGVPKESDLIAASKKVVQSGCCSR